MGVTFDTIDKENRRELVRQVLAKKKGQSDVDWSTMIEEFDLDIQADTLRKAGAGIKLASDAGMLNEFPSDANSDEDATSKAYIERQKLRDIQNQFNKQRREWSRTELLTEAIKESASKLQPLKIDTPALRADIGRKRALVLGIGDLHYGANFVVRGLYEETINAYNPTICQRRLWSILRDTVAIGEKESINTLHIFLVGDLIDGMLMQSQLTRLEYGAVESTMRVAELLAEWIADLAASFSEVHVHSAYGNHSETRPLGSKKGDFPEENLERIVMWWLNERLRNIPHVKCDADSQRFKCINICGFEFLILHGDELRNIGSYARDAVNIYGKKIDFFVCGHYHKEQEFYAGSTPTGNGVIVRVPSICGVDPYAHSKGYGGKPGATAIVIEEGYGRTCVYPLQRDM